jgi:hypothetical protein
MIRVPRLSDQLGRELEVEVVGVHGRVALGANGPEEAAQ